MTEKKVKKNNIEKLSAEGLAARVADVAKKSSELFEKGMREIDDLNEGLESRDPPESRERSEWREYKAKNEKVREAQKASLTILAAMEAEQKISRLVVNEMRESAEAKGLQEVLSEVDRISDLLRDKVREHQEDFREALSMTETILKETEGIMEKQDTLELMNAKRGHGPLH